MTITKKDIIDRVTASTKLKRAVVSDVLHALMDTLGGELAAGRRIEFRDFGVFEVRVRAERAAQNPKTGERVHVPKRASVKFKPGQALRARIEGGSGTGSAEGAGSGAGSASEGSPAGKGEAPAPPVPAAPPAAAPTPRAPIVETKPVPRTGSPSGSRSGSEGTGGGVGS